jgi:hypothetical protein
MLFFGITALEDQSLGGLLMWVPAGFLSTVYGLGLVRSCLEHLRRRRGHAGAAFSNVDSRRP